MTKEFRIIVGITVIMPILCYLALNGSVLGNESYFSIYYEECLLFFTFMFLVIVFAVKKVIG